MSTNVLCDCSDPDIYACFIARHKLDAATTEADIRAAGGPCICTCHPRTSWKPFEDATLWGDDLPPVEIVERPTKHVDPVKMLGRVSKDTNPMIAVYGAGPPGTKCGNCAHFSRHLYHNFMTYKCRERGLTHGPGTDHKTRFPTCAKYVTAQWVIDDAVAKATKKAERKTHIMQPNIATISHSKYETWKQCQERARQQYEEHVNGAPNPATTLGSAFHYALETYTNVLIDTQTPLDEITLLSLAVDKLDADIIDADPSREIFIPHYENMVTRLRTMIRAFYDVIAPKYQPVQRPEQPIKLMLDDDLKLVGVVDAETGKALIDWKTSKSQTNWRGESWIADPTHIAQAMTYLMARPDVQKLTFIVFACDAATPEHCDVVSYPVTRASVNVESHRQALIDVHHEMEVARATGIYHATPGPLCGGKGYACPALQTCKIGQLYLQYAERECDATGFKEFKHNQIRRCPNPDCKSTKAANVSSTFRACGRGFTALYASCDCPDCETAWMLVNDRDGLHISGVKIHNSTPIAAEA